MRLGATSMWSLVLAATLSSLGAAPQAELPSAFSGGLRELASPAPAGSAQPDLASDGRGQVWLSWLETRAAGAHAFRAALLNGTAWSRPVTVAEGPRLLANWADTPSVFVTSTGTLAAHWLERGPGREAYAIRLRTSADRGRSWTAPVVPHRDDSPTEHGFVSFFEAPDVGLGLVWLDGRHTVAPGGAMTLRTTLVTRDGSAGDALVDDRVCDCCQTSAARTVDGVVIAYRDRTADEIRDVTVRRFANGRWSEAATVHADHWRIQGCPVNGPVVAARDASVAVAWFTAVNMHPKVQVAFSSDGGETFGDPIVVSATTTLGRLGMVMPNEGRVLISSVERASGTGQVVVREVRADGRVGTPAVIADTSPERASGFPRIALTDRQVVVAWTDVSGEQPRVRVAMGALR